MSVGARGRLVLPAGLRRRLGVNEGDRLVLSAEDDGSVRMVGQRGVAEAARGAFANLVSGASLVEELLADRRAEAVAEDAGQGVAAGRSSTCPSR